MKVNRVSLASLFCSDENCSEEEEGVYKQLTSREIAMFSMHALL